MVQAGANTTVTGTGSPGNPYIINAVTTPVTVADTNSVNLTLTGTEITADVIRDPVAGNVLTIGPAGLLVSCDNIIATCPELTPVTITFQDTPTVNFTEVAPGPDYVISAVAVPDCVQVRACLSDLPGVLFNPATGTIGPEISATPGNTIVVNPDGLFAPAAAAAPSIVACGLTGDGTALTPLAVDTGGSVWPFACPQVNGADVYCDAATGRVHVDPEKFFVDEFFMLTDPNSAGAPFNINGYAAVIGGPTVDIQSDTFNVVNPSPCRPLTFKLWSGVEHGEIVIQGNGSSYTQWGTHVILTGGVAFDSGQTRGHQSWQVSNTADHVVSRLDTMGARELLGTFTLAPGANVNIELRHTLRVFANGVTATLMGSWRSFVHLQGFTN